MQTLQIEAKSANELLRETPEVIINWLNAVRRQEQVESPRFNWLGIAEVATQRAQEDAYKLNARLDQFSSEQQRALRAALRARHYQDDYLTWHLAHHQDIGTSERHVSDWLATALSAIAWGEVALSTYEYLLSRAASGGRHGYLNSMQNLRAFLITHLGAISDDPVLDPNIVLLSFFDALSITPEVAKKKAAKSKRQLANRETGPQLVRDLRQLRQIKNALGPIALLAERGTIQPSPILAEWLAVRESLP
jgi:hypothetical protein